MWMMVIFLRSWSILLGASSSLVYSHDVLAKTRILRSPSASEHVERSALDESYQLFYGDMCR